MSTDGDTSKRLSDALDQIFSRSAASDEPAGAAEPSDAPEPETYVMPEIVPATEDASDPSGPSLPQRAAAPEESAPTVDARPERPAAAPAAATSTTIGTSAVAPTTPVTSWSDHVAPATTTVPRGGLRTPGRRPRVRRVTRVLRHIDPWSTFKVGLLFSLVAYLVALTSGVLLWRVADSTGTLDNVERWFTQFGWETFELDGSEVFHNAWIIGLFGVVGATGGLVLLATVFNLVSDIIGGVRLTVLEEEVVERTISSTRRYVVRQGPAAAGAAAAPAQDWDVDGGESSTPPRESEPQPSSSAPGQDWSVD